MTFEPFARLLGSNRMRRALDGLRRNPFLTFAPPGHFYSTIPDLAYIREHREVIFDRRHREIPGIDLNEAEQGALIQQFAAFHTDLPFPRTKTPPVRYYYENSHFPYADAIALYCMIRQHRPRRIVEIGSGFSSAVMLDTNEQCFEHSISLTFVEPFPKRLYSLLREDDKERCTIIQKPVQDVPVPAITALEAGDILFVDSSHVVKIGSDVNFLLAEVLPKLPTGVLVHFHDIFWPFEYPEEWIMQGRAWNENYFVRAFLQFNPFFKIVLFNHYLGLLRQSELRRYLPLALNGIGGSLWIQKVS